MNRFLVVKAHLDHVAGLHLVNVVNDVLVVEQGGLDLRGQVLQRSLRPLHPARVLLHPGRSELAHSLRGQGSLRRLVHVLRVLQLVHLAQGHLVQRHERNRVLLRRAAVVGRLGRAVGKVDALAEHVAGDGCLGWRDAQTLREDAAPVGDAGAVPEQLAVLVVDVLLEALLLALALQREDVEHLQLVLRVRRALRLVAVLHNVGVLVRVLVQRLDLAAQRVVGCVQRVLRLRRLAVGDDLVGDLDVGHRVEQLHLLLQQAGGPEHGRLAHAEVVRHKGVELRRELLKARRLRRRQLLVDLLQHLVRRLDLCLRDLAERHLLRVDLQLLQGLDHLALVCDQAHHALHALLQLAREVRRLAAGLRGLLLVVVIVLVVADVDVHQLVLARVLHEVLRLADQRLPVVLGLVAELLAELGDAGHHVPKVREARRPRHTHAAPAGEDDEAAAHVCLQQLDDVELVVVGAHEVGLVQHGLVDRPAVLDDVVRARLA
eukprot:Rhum_TRINITY_DN21127_c0_g1::Rhum_TRINITY_DN21127_c0_g1_i1::g.173164::m.173164